jgi:small redox-active disulfide protein 2
MKLTVYGPGCAKCQELENRARQALVQAGVEGEVVKVKDIGEMMKASVLMTPALAINGKLAVSGKVPPVAEIVTHIMNAMAG